MTRIVLVLALFMVSTSSFSQRSDSPQVEHLTGADVLPAEPALPFSNAGIEGRWAGITDLDEDEWDRVLGINLKGTFLCMKHQARAMLATGASGSIVNVGSVNSFLGFPTGSAYCTSKHGLIGLTTSVSAELASQGIRVNLVCPGIIDTPMHRRAREALGDEVYDQGVLPSVHLKRAGQREEIAETIVFLCSDEASYITGTTLTPDGGLTLTV